MDNISRDGALRRRALVAGAVAVAAAAAGFSGTAVAQADYPSKAITIVVAYAPGGQGDVFARLVGERLGARLRQPVLVDNRPGATGALGTRAVAKARGDGYTLLLGQTGEMAVNRSVVRQLGYDPLRDFKPVVLVGDAALVLVTPANSPFASLDDLVRAARARPGSLSYASSGTATPGHLAAAALALGTKTEMVHIPYKGAGQAMTDVLGGQVQLFFSSASAAMPQVKAGKLKALAVSTPKRLAALPDVPTVAESVVPGFAYSLWGGLFAPADTPDAIVAQLNAAVNDILAEPAVNARLAGDGTVVRRNTPAEFGEFLKREVEKYEGLVRSTGIQAE